MGVKGLETYMEERKGKLCYPVNINEEIEKFKKGLTGSSKPEVLVDAQCTLRLLNKGLDWICGGQYIDCGKKIKSFVEAIREAGAEPIFFYDGPCLDQKRNEWIKRRVRYYTEIQKLMNKIRTRNSVAEKEPFMIPTGITMFQRYVLAEECCCKVIITSEECDEEIAMYAKQNSRVVVAIIAQDSDFVIYNAAQYYLSASHLDLNKMTTNVYSSEELVNCNNLDDPQWLPVIAALLGNDYLSQDRLTAFHRRITNWQEDCYIPHSHLIPAVAKIVTNKLELTMSVDDMSTILNKEVFEESASDENELAIKNALKSFYLLNTPSESKKNELDEYSGKLLKAMRKHSNFDPMSEQVLVHQCVQYTNALEDLNSRSKKGSRSLNSPLKKPLVLIFRPINLRFVGILRKHQQEIPGKDSVDEYAVHSADSVKHPNKVEVSFPPFDFDLLELTESNDTTLVSEKLKILLWAVTGKNLFTVINEESEVERTSEQSEMERKFLSIKPKFSIVSLVLYYLYRCENILKLEDIDLFVTMFVILDSESATRMNDSELDSDLKVTKKIRAQPDYKAVHLATVFNWGVEAIGRVASVFGPFLPSSSFAHHNFFDGILFQKIFMGKIIIDKSSESEAAKTTRAAIFDFMKLES